jgi:hypothetical protein
MPITFVQRPDSAKAIVFPPTPANISIITVLDGLQNAAKSSATLLFDDVSNVIDREKEDYTLRLAQVSLQTKHLQSSECLHHRERRCSSVGAST